MTFKEQMHQEYVKAVEFEKEACREYNANPTTAAKMVLDMARREVLLFEDILNEERG